MRKFIALALGCVALALGQDTEKETIQFSNPSAPHKLNVELIMGNVTVKGYDGRDVVIDYSTSGIPNIYRRGRAQEPAPPGMHRIGGSRALDISESNNTVTIKTSFPINGDFNIQVPADTSVRVNTIGGKAITIDNISGEIEASNMNGQVTVTNASGPVVASSMNGKVTVSLNRVPPDKDMSFSTMNGIVDVTLPADARANFKMRADNGDIYTDFDVKLDGQAAPQTGKRRSRDGGTQSGTINGGGPEIQFTTFNGRIVIHKK
ncbi:MAG TPA: hypothetical protein VIY49_37480 [Bryobacteraceae bacterium]